MSLKTRISLLAEPPGQAEPGPACAERIPLGLPVAGILSPQERALGGISTLRRGTEAACNLVYEFDPNLLCRFIPLELKERYSNTEVYITHGCYTVTSMGDKVDQFSVSIPFCLFPATLPPSVLLPPESCCCYS